MDRKELLAAVARRNAKVTPCDAPAPPTPTNSEPQTTSAAGPTEEEPAPATPAPPAAAVNSQPVPAVRAAAEEPAPATPTPSASALTYKMMLRAGVPVCSVLRKMGEGKFDIALFDQEFASADVEAFYRPAFNAATGAVVKPLLRAVVPSSPQSVRKKIHLPIIAKTKTTLPIAAEEEKEARPSVWLRNCINFQDDPISAKTLAEYNKYWTKRSVPKAKKAASTSDGASTTTNATTLKKNPALLDKGRAQNLAILLVGMKLSTNEWRQCVLSMTFNENFSENLKMLLLAWPTSDEERAIQAYSGDGEKLGRAEEFLVGLRDIPRLKEKIKCLHFRLQFSSRVFELRVKMVDVVRCINQVIEKETFAAAMQRIFRLCYVLNSGIIPSDDEIEAEGFRISALTQLLCTRSFDPAVTVLGLFANAIERDCPKRGAFVDELTMLSKCANVPVETLRTEYASLKGGFEIILSETNKCAASDLAAAASNPALVEDLTTYHAIVDSFAAEAEHELSDLRSEMRNLDQACTRLNEYLKEPEETPLSEILSHITAFVEAYKAERAKIAPVVPIERESSHSEPHETSESGFISPPSSTTSESSPRDSIHGSEAE